MLFKFPIILLHKRKRDRESGNSRKMNSGKNYLIYVDMMINFAEKCVPI